MIDPMPFCIRLDPIHTHYCWRLPPARRWSIAVVWLITGRVINAVHWCRCIRLHPGLRMGSELSTGRQGNHWSGFRTEFRFVSSIDNYGRSRWRPESVTFATLCRRSMNESRIKNRPTKFMIQPPWLRYVYSSTINLVLLCFISKACWLQRDKDKIRPISDHSC